MFVQHKRNRRAVNRANMSSDYQKERPADREPGPANKYNRSQTFNPDPCASNWDLVDWRGLLKTHNLIRDVCGEL